MTLKLTPRETGVDFFTRAERDRPVPDVFL